MNKLADNPELLKRVSKAIHLEEWCPGREKCSGTSASSDAHARVALREIDTFLAHDEIAAREAEEVDAALAESERKRGQTP